MTLRRRARELAFQILFQADAGKTPVEDVLEAVREERPDEDWPFIVDVATGVAARRAALDREIADHLSGWSLDRVASSDRCILRMALYELEEMATPPSIVINEAVELAKKYGAGESGRFVNGVLGAVYRERQAAGGR